MVQSGQPVAQTTDPGRRDRLSTTAFVVGLVAALTGVVYFVSVPVGLVGLVIGGFAIRRRGSDRRVVLGGIMLSIIGLLVGLGVIAFLVLEDDDDGGPPTVVDGIESGTHDAEHPPQRDLNAPVVCQVEAHALRASGQVTNNSGTVADYQLIATWERDGKQIAESTALVDSVPPGITRSWEVIAVGDSTTGTTTCRVLRIDRTPA